MMLKGKKIGTNSCMGNRIKCSIAEQWNEAEKNSIKRNRKKSKKENDGY